MAVLIGALDPLPPPPPQAASVSAVAIATGMNRRDASLRVFMGYLLLLPKKISDRRRSGAGSPSMGLLIGCLPWQRHPNFRLAGSFCG
jgi:hypothetical protein